MGWLLATPCLALASAGVLASLWLAARIPRAVALHPGQPELLWGQLLALGLCVPLLVFWLRSGLRLAGRIASPAGPGTRLGAIGTAALGAAAAAVQPDQFAAGQLAFATSATCFSAFFVLWCSGGNPRALAVEATASPGRRRR